MDALIASINKLANAGKIKVPAAKAFSEKLRTLEGKQLEAVSGGHHGRLQFRR